jgi:ankyrin repeat protein
VRLTLAGQPRPLAGKPRSGGLLGLPWRLEGAAGSAGRAEPTSGLRCTRGCGLFLGLGSGPQATQGDAVSDSLPERPDLGQLRLRAKELRDAARRGDAPALERLARHHPAARGGVVRLAAAQLVIARELGFPSWPRLVAAAGAGAAARRLAADFAAASVEGRMRRAGEILRADPGIAGRGLPAASVLGDAGAVREHLAVRPAAAVAPDDERGWPPLLYACYSRWHQADPGRASGLAEVVRLLLEAGAGPDTNDAGRARFRSALTGSVEVNNPEVTGVLLEAGANPDLGQPVAEAAAHRDLRCLRLLLSRRARVAGTWALGAAVDNDNPAAATLLLGALAAGGGLAAGGRLAADAATEALPDAASAGSLPLVAALLDAGADPRGRDQDGMSALRLAVRAGRPETAARLRAAGAAEDSTDIDQFLGACRGGDRQESRRLLAGHPDLLSRLSDADREVVCDAAASGPAGTLALLLDLGFSPHDRKFGEQPLHVAAYHGNSEAARLLLEKGAEVDARDTSFDATPLAFATVGSGERAGRAGDWTGTVRLLIEAGACRQDVWISGKPPSEEVADLLRRHGITPGPESGQRPGQDDDQGDDPAAAPGPPGDSVMAEIARHLETAFRDRDLDLLGSLLHPQARWTGLCEDRAQVLDWYRALLAEGTVATVRSAEVDRDAVVLGLAVTGRAEGARPAPPQQVYQAFTVDDAQIVEIRGYADRTSALARAAGPAAP